MAPAGFTCTCCGFASKMWQGVAPWEGQCSSGFSEVSLDADLLNNHLTHKLLLGLELQPCHSSAKAGVQSQAVSVQRPTL